LKPHSVEQVVIDMSLKGWTDHSGEMQNSFPRSDAVQKSMDL